MVLNNVKGFDGPYEAPLKLPTRKVLKSWIDYNGHMNVAYYTLAFDKALDDFLEKNLKDLDEICEECHKEDESVTQNLIMTGYKLCKSCRTSKTVFPL